MSIVVFRPLYQLRVPPLHEGVQVSSSWRSHCDLVTVGPDLQSHQGDEGPQGFIGLLTAIALAVDKQKQETLDFPNCSNVTLTMLTKLTTSKILFLSLFLSSFIFLYWKVTVFLLEQLIDDEHVVKLFIYVVFCALYQRTVL